MGIKVRAIRQLLAQSGALAPWTHPPDFGGQGYNIQQRLQNAGITWKQLHEAGFTVQSDIHHRYIAVKDAPDATARREGYRVQHGGDQVDPRVTRDTCPSGLRPLKVPNSAKAPDLANWTAVLNALIAPMDPESEVMAPGVHGQGAVPGNSAEATSNAARNAPVIKGSPGYVVFKRSLDAMSAHMTTVLASLRGGEDQGVLAPLADSYAAWSGGMPDLAKVTNANFDTSVVSRVGVEVELLPAADAARKMADFLTKIAKLAAAPLTYKVERVNYAAASAETGEVPTTLILSGEGLTKPLVVRLGDVRRVVRAAPEKVDPTTWKPQEFGFATFMDEEVAVGAIDLAAGTATITMPDGAEMEGVPLSELTAPKA